MTSFCVFGVTMEDCIEKAIKKTKVFDKKLKRPLTVDEHKAKADALAKELFDACNGAKQISPAFDAPQFAKDWIEVAKKTIEYRSILLMCRGKKYDKKGSPIMRKGHHATGWMPYKP